MLRVGLTGGIASGKSTVAAMLERRGFPVLQLDPLGHYLLEPGQPAHEETVREFGSEILDQDGSIDRARLGAIVFSDANKRERLNQILHPRILEAAAKWLGDLDRPGGPALAFVEAALILEAHYDRQLDCVVVCWCRPEQQIERLQKRGLSADQARQRIEAQMSVDEKRRLADEVVDCSVSLEQTEAEVDALLDKLKQSAALGRPKN